MVYGLNHRSTSATEEAVGRRGPVFRESLGSKTIPGRAVAALFTVRLDNWVSIP